MPDKTTGLIADAFAQRKDAVMHRLSSELAAMFPKRFLLEAGSSDFNVFQFALEGLCELATKPGVHSQFDALTNAGYTRTYYMAHNAWQCVKWEGHEFDLVTIGVEGHFHRLVRQYLVGPDQETTERFFLTVTQWNTSIRNEILVYSEGWQKDADLYYAIKSSTLENLVLEGDLKDRIADDFKTFFEAQETYERYGIPWKRGVLFLGPPGNGKTHCIKALINLLDVPAIYVRSFSQEFGTDNSSIQQIFQRARQTAPCIMVLEDLDSLLTDANRSYFLNEMDGFAANEGVMVLASTNHPERLDTAILERPSRFDRKYTFNLPDPLCREQYIKGFCENLENTLRLSEGDAMRIAELTHGFSYAYLKELVLSSMMAWIHNPDQLFITLLSETSTALFQQMRTAAEKPSGEAGPDSDSSRQPKARPWNRRQ